MTYRNDIDQRQTTIRHLRVWLRVFLVVGAVYMVVLAPWILLVMVAEDGPKAAWRRFQARYDDVSGLLRWVFREIAIRRGGYPVRLVDAALGDPLPSRPPWMDDGKWM